MRQTNDWVEISFQYVEVYATTQDVDVSLKAEYDEAKILENMLWRLFLKEVADRNRQPYLQKVVEELRRGRIVSLSP